MLASEILRGGAVFSEKRFVKAGIFGKTHRETDFVYGIVGCKYKLARFFQSEFNQKFVRSGAIGVLEYVNRLVFG